MKGIITSIKMNQYGQEYGFIVANDESYYFDSRYLAEGDISGFSKHTVVEFDPDTNPHDWNKKIAINVKLANIDSAKMEKEGKNGYISAYYNDKGYGFINEDIYFHFSSIKNKEEYAIDLKSFDYKVSYFEVENPRKEDKKMAVNIWIREKTEKQIGQEKQPELLSEEAFEGMITYLKFDNENKFLYGFIREDKEELSYYFNNDDVDMVDVQTLEKRDCVIFDSYSEWKEDKRRAHGVKKAPLIGFTEEDLEMIFRLFDEEFDNNEKINIAQLGNFLKEKCINFRKWGYKTVLDFCSEGLRSFLEVKRIITDGKSITYDIVFHRERKTRWENIDLPKEKEIPEEVKRNAYVILCNHFVSGKQSKLKAVGKILSDYGIKMETYGFKSVYDFLRAFSFLEVEEKLIVNDVPIDYVTIHRVENWDTNQLQEEDTRFELQTPGLNEKFFCLNSDREDEAIKLLSKIFYVSYANEIEIKGNKYSYGILVPSALVYERLGFTKAILAIYSDSKLLENNIRNILSFILEEIPRITMYAVDRFSVVLISEDINVKDKIKELSADISENVQAIIPFYTDELIVNFNNSPFEQWLEYVVDRFAEFSYSRDLFAMDSAITEDMYFFGRQDYVHGIVQKLNSHECSGVFGLRKSGKTSVLNAIGRELDSIKQPYIFVDCSRLGMFEWHIALYDLIERVYKIPEVNLTLEREEYDERGAVKYFEVDMLRAIESLGEKGVVILFDEVESVTFDISQHQRWRDDGDSLNFWTLIRSFYQAHKNRFAFVLAGTNPFLAEEPLTKMGNDNPMYRFVTTNKYLPLFSAEETKVMLKKLGTHMGLKFEDSIFVHITQDYGGQPYIIRQLCSRINDYIENDDARKKPITISNTIYDYIKEDFDQSEVLDNYCNLILHVLKNNYPEEYKMLEAIALNDKKTISEQKGNQAVFAHLKGYGILEEDGSLWGFKNNSIKNYLQEKMKYKKLLQTPEEYLSEINDRRTKLEFSLRDCIRRNLYAILGEDEAKRRVVMVFSRREGWKVEYEQLRYKDLFNPSMNGCCYFKDLFDIIDNNWDCFKNIFDDKKHFREYRSPLNLFRTDGAHPKELTENEMQIFRGAISWFEEKLENM